eukprot:CAMPEP_0201723158 /NCGR_PEP_ID=MMETSP0593-20130828/7294_1 /ASSEMBLY_ACC=CAM_ASM_000672 /TAXON_ID=267983 /ORGANISM="Skeletonema japonicum, Strain CCMP2506" /LENGTH=883 /DNA_ID=CAMNT_0048214223 /DNA_START=273 /DNA_END=2924 /DNA_ORIENTATION=+
MMAPSAETMVLPVAASSVHHAASSSATETGEASRPPVKQQSHPTSSPSPDQSLTTPKRFRVKNVSLPESSSSIAAEKSSSDNAVTPSTVGPAETPDSVMVGEENPVTASSAETTSLTAVNGGAHGQQWGTAARGNDHSSSTAGGGGVSASERVMMNNYSRSGMMSNHQQHHHQQQQSQPLHNHQVVMTNNHSKAPSSAAFTQITPSIKLGPRITHGGGNNNREQGDGQMPSPVKLNMHRRGQSGQESFEELPSKKESSSSSSPPLPIASAPTARAAPNTPSKNAIQNASQQQLQQQQQKQQQSNRFKVEHQQLPPPTFLAAKISPLRSKSSRAKKADLKTRGKTPPPPPSSTAIAAASNSADQNNLLSPGMFLAPRTPRSAQSGVIANAKTTGMTPTNFASDFGKGFKQQDPIQYDPANSFAWLDTPGGHGLFSPNGGLTTYSAHNTPRGMYGFLGSGKTPGGNIPDAEVLKANGDLGVNTPKVPDAQQGMICISPLNSKKGKSKSFSVPETPMSINYSEIFASPQSTIRRADIHTAENNINIDADLNALLQLAETTTPGGTRPVTFMSPVLSTHLRRQSTNGDGQAAAEPPSSLQLPIISGTSAAAAEKGTPQLSIRSTTNGRSTTKGSGTGRKRGRPPKNKNKNVETPASKQQKQPPKQPPMQQQQQQQQYQELPTYQPQVMHYHGGAPQQYYHHPPHHHQGWVYPGQPPQYSYADQPRQQSASPEDAEGKTVTRGRGKRRVSAKVSNTVESSGKRVRRASPKKSKVPQELNAQDNEKIEAAIGAVRRSGVGVKQKKSPEDKGTLPRGVTMRPSGKWQAQLYYAGKSRYIGVFDSREKACLAYEISREVLKTDKGEDPKPSEIDANINLARKAAFSGVGKN